MKGERVVVPSKNPAAKAPPCVWREGCWDVDRCRALGHCQNEPPPEDAETSAESESDEL